MGKTLRDEDLKLNIIVNGDKSKKELGDLEQSTRELVQQTKELRLEKKKLEAAGKKETEEYKAVTKAIKENSIAIDANDARMKELRSEIGLTGLTMKQLRQEQKLFKAQMDNATYGTAQWKRLDIELKKVEAQMHKVKSGGNGMRQSMGKIADGFNRFALLGASVIATLTGIAFKFSSIIKGNAELSDSFADVRKTTGLTDKEVKELYKTLKTFDTRTANKELLGLARIAGKLGISGIKDVEGFVRAADKINVALSEDLGGNTEEAINHIGKLVAIFKIKEEYGLEEGMMKIGSAINALGAASTASEGYLVEFTKRVAGIAPNANISAADTLGLAAALDQLGQTAEVSSTVFSKLIIAIGKDIPRYAKMAGMSTQQLSDLLASDTNEALLTVLDSAKSTEGGVTGMVKSLEMLGVEGQRSAAVLGALIENTDTIREAQRTANEEFEKGTSLQEEFNIKNATLGATLEKLTKDFAALFMKTSVMEFLERVVISLYINFDRLVKGIGLFLKIIAVGTTALVSYRLAILLAGHLTKQYTVYTNLAAAATRVFNTVVKSNPVGLLVSVLTSAASAFFLFRTKAKDATKQQSNFNKELENTERIINKEKILKFLREVGLLKKELKEISPGIFIEKEVLDTTEAQINKLNAAISKLSVSELKELFNVLSDEVVEIKRELGDSDLADILVGDMAKKAGELYTLENSLFLINKELEKASKIRPFAENIIESEEDLQKALLELRKQYGLIKQKELFVIEMQALDENKAARLLSEEEYYKASKAIYDKYFPEGEKNKMDPFPDEETIQDESTYLIQKYQETLEGRKVMLDAMLEAEIISLAEYKDRVALIDQEILDSKRRTTDEWINSMHYATDAISSMFQMASSNEIQSIEQAYNYRIEAAEGNAEKQKQLQKELDEEKRKLEKKWALRQAILSSGMVLMEGGVELARINSNPVVTADLTQSLRVALTTAAIIRTIANEAAIWSNYAAASNFWSGGHTGPGRKYEPKGTVHANEYVVNQEGMQDPVISNFISSYVEPKRLRSLNYSGLNEAINYTRGYTTGGGVGYSQPVTNNINVDNSDLKAELAASRQVMSLMVQYLKTPPVAIVPPSTWREGRQHINEANAIENFE